MWIQCNVILNSNFTNCVKVLIATHFNSAGGLIGQQMRHMWHEQNILKQTSQWQQVLTETWNWHNMDTAANNDALYIASSVTLLSSPLLSLLWSLCPTWGDNKKQDRSGHLTLETEAWPGASPHPRPWGASANQRPGWHQVTNQRASPAHVSVVWRCLTWDVSMCKTRTQRDSGFRSSMPCNCGECTEKFRWPRFDIRRFFL